MNKIYSIFIVGLLFTQNNSIANEIDFFLDDIYKWAKVECYPQVKNAIHFLKINQGKTQVEVYLITNHSFIFQSKITGKAHTLSLNNPMYLTAFLNGIMDLRKDLLIGSDAGLNYGNASTELKPIAEFLIRNRSCKLRKGIEVMDENITFQLIK